jgi:hypothetical protein
MMIRLKHLLQEMNESDLDRCLTKIKNKQFKLIGAGDNGRVYEIDGEDKAFKITKEQDEYAVAERIVNRYTEFTTFIPIYYVNGKDMYIMANANSLSSKQRMMFDQFVLDYNNYARNEGGEVSIFDFMSVTDNVNPQLDNFLNALHADVEKLNIPEFDLDLDFRTDNIMVWNGKMVMVDW